MTDTILTFLLAVIPVVLAITLHEAAHGYAAWALGDDTAKSLGRLSLNPLRHVDRVGTLLLPGFLLVSQILTIGHVAFLFGWAKPVPVAAWKFANPRRGMMLVAAAGPAMNFTLAWLAAVAIYAVDALPARASVVAGEFIYYFMLSNIVLGLFNLLPIPPLDGGRIAVGLLPERAAMAWAKLERLGLLIVVGVVLLLPRILRSQGIAFDPVGEALETVVQRAIHLALTLAGHGADE